VIEIKEGVGAGGHELGMGGAGQSLAPRFHLAKDSQP